MNQQLSTKYDNVKYDGTVTGSFEETLKDVVNESLGRQAFNYASFSETIELRQCSKSGKCAEPLSAHAVTINALCLVDLICRDPSPFILVSVSVTQMTTNLSEGLHALLSHDSVLPTTL